LELLVLFLSEAECFTLLSTEIRKSHAFLNQLFDILTALGIIGSLIGGLGVILTLYGKRFSVELGTLIVIEELGATIYGFGLP
jgi:hypothetical protein